MTLLQRVKFWLVGFLGALLVRGLAATLRFHFIGERDPARPDHTGIVYGFWHSQLLTLGYLYRNRNIHVLVSKHRDGEYIVRVTRWLAFGAVRGSSTRGGIRALSEALDKLAEGIDIAVTPDGPRGPRQRFKLGMLFLARKSGAPIVLGACVPQKAWRLNSWDGFYIPKPFSRVVVIVGERVYIPETAGNQELEEKRVELENTLNELTRRAEEEANRL